MARRTHFLVCRAVRPLQLGRFIVWHCRLTVMSSGGDPICTCNSTFTPSCLKRFGSLPDGNTAWRSERMVLLLGGALITTVRPISPRVSPMLSQLQRGLTTTSFSRQTALSPHGVGTFMDRRMFHPAFQT